MPIEIRELVIRAEIINKSTTDNKSVVISKVNTERVVNECVDRVLQILKDKKER